MTDKTVLQIGAKQFRAALKSVNRRTRLDMIKIMFPEMSNVDRQNLADSVDQLTLKSSFQLLVPAVAA